MKIVRPALRALFWGRRRLMVWALAVLFGSLGYWQETRWREQHSFAGLPAMTDWKDWRQWHRVLRNPGFMVGYSDIRGLPLWAIYRLAPIPDNHSGIGARPSRFASDWRALVPVTHEAYSHSGYDRGHMAPNYAIASLYGREAQVSTFTMTNIAPQKPDLNRQWWQRLEEVAIDRLAPMQGELWVITGPIFDDQPQRLPVQHQCDLNVMVEHFTLHRMGECLGSGWRVEIPDAFFKIFLVPGHGPGLEGMKALAFIVPQDVNGQAPLARYHVSIDDIEARVGLDFFPELPPDMARTLEASDSLEGWHPEQWSQIKGRFSR